MSLVLGQLKKLKTKKQPPSDDYHNEYESIDLVKAVTARTKSSSSNCSVKLNAGDINGGYDPTHLYGPVATAAAIAPVAESEYAEIGGR
jgi:hypothetical protein